jgi:hypothetical protein
MLTDTPYPFPLAAGDIIDLVLAPDADGDIIDLVLAPEPPPARAAA